MERDAGSCKDRPEAGGALPTVSDGRSSGLLRPEDRSWSAAQPAGEARARRAHRTLQRRFDRIHGTDHRSTTRELDQLSCRQADEGGTTSDCKTLPKGHDLVTARTPSLSQKILQRNNADLSTKFFTNWHCCHG